MNETCVAIKNDGTSCRNYVVTGETKCGAHLGRTKGNLKNNSSKPESSPRPNSEDMKVITDSILRVDKFLRPNTVNAFKCPHCGVLTEI